MYSFLQRYLEQFAANLDGLITYLQESLNKCMIGAVLFSLDWTIVFVLFFFLI